MKAKAVLLAAWQHNKILPVILALLLAANVVVYIVHHYGVSPRAATLQQQVLSRQSQIREMEQAGARLDSPRAVFQAGKEDLQAFRAAVPSRENLSQLVAEIFSLARHAGLSLERITYDPQYLQDGALLSYTLVFSVTGSYEQLKRFIFSLEHAPRLIALDEIAFSAGDATKRTATLNLRMTTYFQADAT